MLLDLFDLPRGSGEEGKKEAKIERIMAFLEKPEESGKKNLFRGLPLSSTSCRTSGAKKEKAASKKAKTTGGKATKLPDDAAAIKAELEKMAARQAALLKKLERTVEGGGEKRKAPAASTPTKKAKTSEETAEDGGKDSGMPTDEAIKAAVVEMLDGQDVDAISMKKVRADLEEKFGVPLVEKKTIIKELWTAYVDSEPRRTRSDGWRARRRHIARRSRTTCREKTSTAAAKATARKKVNSRRDRLALAPARSPKFAPQRR